MSSGKGDSIAKTVGELIPVVKDAYKDAVQPLAQELGQSLGQVGSFTSSVLRPFRSAQMLWDSLFDRLDPWLAMKLKRQPVEDIIEPSPTVAGPTLAGLVYNQEQPELRDMFLNLLATSMVRGKANSAHPAFAEFLRQIVPDEARVMQRLLGRGRAALIHVLSYSRIDGKNYDDWRLPSAESTEGQISQLFAQGGRHSLFQKRESPTGGFIELGAVSEFDAELCAKGEFMTPHLENLERLGLVRLDDQASLVDKGKYLSTIRGHVLVDMCSGILRAGGLPGLEPGLLKVTQLGKMFLVACVAGPDADTGDS
ncbi:MAG: DUF4393 domain-containing protein [Planctomycetes bacterium]|nr:DUF4393 domain-containing protein [Planctomycetota bacterium]